MATTCILLPFNQSGEHRKRDIPLIRRSQTVIFLGDRKNIFRAVNRKRRLDPKNLVFSQKKGRTESTSQYVLEFRRTTVRLKNSLGPGAVGLLDAVHVLTDWTHPLLPHVPPWLGVYASGFATAILLLATWFVIPRALSYVMLVGNCSIRAHSAINRAGLAGALQVVSFFVRSLGMVEAYLKEVDESSSQLP
jgi:hypothetical protein